MAVSHCPVQLPTGTVTPQSLGEPASQHTAEVGRTHQALFLRSALCVCFSLALSYGHSGAASPRVKEYSFYVPRETSGNLFLSHRAARPPSDQAQPRRTQHPSAEAALLSSYAQNRCTY